MVITDINPARLKLAAEVAEVRPVNVVEEDLHDVMNGLGMREGFDVGLEMSGAEAAFDQMLDHMIVGGRIAMLGLPAEPYPVDWSKFVLKQLTIKGIYGREMFETWHKMLAMLQSGLDVRKVITHRFPIDRFQEGFEAMRSGRKRQDRARLDGELGGSERYRNAEHPSVFGDKIPGLGCASLAMTERFFGIKTRTLSHHRKQ